MKLLFPTGQGYCPWWLFFVRCCFLLGLVGVFHLCFDFGSPSQELQLAPLPPPRASCRGFAHTGPVRIAGYYVQRGLSGCPGCCLDPHWRRCWPGCPSSRLCSWRRRRRCQQCPHQWCPALPRFSVRWLPTTWLPWPRPQFCAVVLGISKTFLRTILAPAMAPSSSGTLPIPAIHLVA